MHTVSNYFTTFILSHIYSVYNINNNYNNKNKFIIHTNVHKFK